MSGQPYREADGGSPTSAAEPAPSAAPTPPSPPVRRRRARGSLGREEILDAAEVLAAQSPDSLTMRAVAAAVGAVPMALYNHVATKDELVDALLDRVLTRFEAPASTGDPAADLLAFGRAHRAVLAAHPWAVASLVRHPNPGPGAARIGELALATLERAGITGDRAVAAFSGLVALSYGWSSFTAARALDQGGPADAVAAQVAALPADVFPRTVAVAGEMGAYGSEEHYDLVLAALVTGLLAD